jgi:hypothetical protein
MSGDIGLGRSFHHIAVHAWRFGDALSAAGRRRFRPFTSARNSVATFLGALDGQTYLSRNAKSGVLSCNDFANYNRRFAMDPDAFLAVMGRTIAASGLSGTQRFTHATGVSRHH